jgi:hypothetical protein
VHEGGVLEPPARGSCHEDVQARRDSSPRLQSNGEIPGQSAPHMPNISIVVGYSRLSTPGLLGSPLPLPCALLKAGTAARRPPTGRGTCPLVRGRDFLPTDPPLLAAVSRGDRADRTPDQTPDLTKARRLVAASCLPQDDCTRARPTRSEHRPANRSHPASAPHPGARILLPGRSSTSIPSPFQRSASAGGQLLDW